MSEPNETPTRKKRETTPVSMWKETDDILKLICEDNRKSPITSHRKYKGEELHHLVVEEARARGLL